MHKPAWMLSVMLGLVGLGLFSPYVIAQEQPVSAAEASGQPWQVLAYRLALAADGKTYQVLMKPTVTPKPDLSLSGQVTVKVPHKAAFQITQLTSAMQGAEWVEASRVDAPTEDPVHDYISFSFVGLKGGSARHFAWKANTEQLIFSFQNAGGCVNDVTLMRNNDPFNAAPNSANTNPGNHFANLGWGDVSQNNYQDSDSTAINCAK
jgi:hypothetical protein